MASSDSPGSAGSRQHRGRRASRYAPRTLAHSVTRALRSRGGNISLRAMLSYYLSRNKWRARLMFIPGLSVLVFAGGLLPVQAQTGPRSTDDVYLARAKRILSQTPLIDGHNDLPWRIREDSIARGNVDAYDLRRRTPGHTDLDRLRKGMIGAQFWSVYTPGEYRDSGYARVQLEQIEIARRFIAKYPDRLSLGALRAYYDLGVRYMTLTHNVTLDWADAALDSARHNGLTPFGDSVVREMNRLGMLVDLAHVSPPTISAALNVSQAPVIFSHSGARALVDVPRTVPDSILRRVTKNGGIVMVPFVPGFVSPA